MPIDIAPDVVTTVTITGAEFNKAIADAVAEGLKSSIADVVAEGLKSSIADAVAEGLKSLGFGARKVKPAAPKLGYSVREAAAASGLGRTTLYAAVRRHELRVVKKGARTIILDRDLRRWLEGLPASNA